MTMFKRIYTSIAPMSAALRNDKNALKRIAQNIRHGARAGSMYLADGRIFRWSLGDEVTNRKYPRKVPCGSTHNGTESRS